MRKSKDKRNKYQPCKIVKIKLKMSIQVKNRKTYFNKSKDLVYKIRIKRSSLIMMTFMKMILMKMLAIKLLVFKKDLNLYQIGIQL